VDYVNAGKLFFLLERGFYEAALQEGRGLLDVDRKLPPNLVAGMANLMSTYRRRATSETASQDETSAVGYVFRGSGRLSRHFGVGRVVMERDWTRRAWRVEGGERVVA
jgi:hypothetical protein